MSGTSDDDRQKLPGELQELVDKAAQSQGLHDYKVTVLAGLGEGDNFMSDIVKVRLEGASSRLALVLKVMPRAAHELTQARREVYFRTELAMYDEVVPAMRQLHLDKLPLEHGTFLGVPCFYGGFYRQGAGALALSDMSAEGYRLADRCAGLDVQHCRLGVRELARLHALSFALKDQRPRQFETLADLVKDEVYVRPILIDYLKGMARHAERALLKTLPAEDSVYVRRFRESVPQLTADLLDMVTRQAAEPYAVIGHGDCWTSNYIFKYAEDGATPVAACMVDLQISRCGSPLCDLAYFLSSSPACGIRKTSYQELTSYYYTTLSEYLQQLGSDPHRLFPLSAFKEHERRFSKLGLCLALMYTHINVAPPGTHVDVEWMLKNPEQLGDDLLSPLYASRITDLIVHMVDHDFI